ncbi:DUF5590 domain-containing protein [Paenibacillus hamazuiensis]|uniref:cell wall elongation regulator TseB-like domain-containing protein n=1 Tax=Paenibacillus hamazuiensis TaxID=2936508 RepID=UPI0020103F88|nr:DUF5590 domain-containing protein [Paenibacillus hamazuiensis]
MKLRYKILIGLSVVVAAIVFFGFKFLASVEESEWSVQRQAVKVAYEKTILVKPVKVERFIGNKQYTIIHGEDKIGQPIIVWVSDDEVITEMASDGVTADQVKEAVLAKNPDSTVLRTTPGKLGDRLVWEAFYKYESEQGWKYFYDYYDFKDGTLIDTYKLSLQ